MPFSFLNRDALQALYGEHPDGIMVERFDTPFDKAELDASDPPFELRGIAKIVYANRSLLKGVARLGVEIDLDNPDQQTDELREALLGTVDDGFIARWRTRLSRHNDNIQISAHTDNLHREPPSLMLSTTPITYKGKVYGCRTRITDATPALTRDAEEHRALLQIEAFVRTENVPLICLEFAQPLTNPVSSGQLGAAYQASKITHVTDAAAHMFGASPNALLKKSLASTNNARIATLLSSAFPTNLASEVLNLGDTKEILVESTDADRSVYRVKPTFVFDDGKAIEVWMRIEDETSKQRVVQLQQTVEQTRNLALEAASLYQFDINARTKELRADTTGLEAMGLMNTPTNFDDWLKLIDPENLNISVEEFKKKLSGSDKAVNLIARLKNDDGEDRSLELWGEYVPGSADGILPGRVIGLYRDATQTEKLNARLREKKTLESLGVLAGGVAHDFNNLLMSVLGYAELMEADVLDSPQHDQSPLLQGALQNLSEIRAAALRASELCTSLLAYAGQHLIEKKLIDLTELVRTTSELVLVTIGKRVPLVWNLDNEVMIAADKGQLTQVIINLVGNAADAMLNRKGVVEVGIDTTVLTVDEQALLGGQIDEPNRRLACLTVRDSGCGMSKETLERMYEPFYSTKSEGRGLGMAAVHGIVKNHGGGILVNSIEGKGTEFRVCFPLLAQTPTSEHNLSALPQSVVKASPNVLVVDDEAGVRRIAAEMLRHLSCNVQEADSAEQALALFAHQTFDYVLLDITMPVMSGSELAEILLERVPNLKVVLCSGYTEKDVPEALLRRCTFIHKPYTLKEVSDALHLEQDPQKSPTPA